MAKSRLHHLLTTGLIAVLLSGCQSKDQINEDTATEACVYSIKDNLKAPSTFNLVEKTIHYSPVMPIGDDDKSLEYKYLNIDISYDAENSFGAPLRQTHQCNFLVKGENLEDLQNLKIKYARNKAENSKVCLEKTIKSKSDDRPLACYAPADLKKECCLPSDHYKYLTGERMWK